jgi:type VI secretion system protein ImpL
VTFPYEQTASGEAAQADPAEFDTLIGRLNGRLFARVEEDRDVRRRVKLFAFPQQMAALREALTQFVRDVFDSSGFDRPILLRGVYFTSGTQEGTPIDRLLGAIGRRFGVAADAVAFPAGRGKAYFVERLLKTVLIGESGLAGVNRRVEVQKAALQLAAYAAMALIVAAGVLAWSLSYRRNSIYLDEVAAEVAKLRQVPEVRADAPLEKLLPRLDATGAVVASANRYQAATPRAMRWGLYQGASVTKSAQDAYVRELDGLVLPQFAARIKARLTQYEREPDKVYEYLKAYLMLGEPKRIDVKHLRALADLEWKRPAPSQVGGRTATSLSEHFESLLDYSDELRPVPLDPAVVARARGTIRQASIPKIMYSRIKRDYDDDPRTVAIDAAAGLGVERVLKRKSGISLSQPVPALYGRAVFKEVTGRGAAELIKDLSTDDWVWGGTALSVENPLKLAGDVFDIYERDYITVWDAALNDLELATFPTVRQTADALGTLSGPTSPLRGLLRVVADNTMLIDVPDAAAPPSSGALSSAKNAVADRLGKLLKSAQQASGASTRMPGTLVTAHFQPIHRLLAGAPGMAPIDKILDRIAQIQQELNSLGPGVGNTDALTALSSPSLRGFLQSLKEDAALLPPSVETLVTQIGHRAQGSVVSDATDNLERRYREQLVEPCLAVVAGRYPFVVGSTQDVTLKDFARLFGPGGLFEGFFNDNHLDRLADTSHSPWTWRNGGPNLSPRMLAQFEAAERVREVFFPSGALGMGLGFKVSFSGLDPRLTRFALQIDNQYYEIRHSPPPQTRSAKWPASDPGNAIAQFEGLGGPLTVARFDGPWAWFRLMDVGRPQRESDLRVSLAFQRDDYKVQAMIEPDSIRNPFTNRAWRNFSCGS